MGKITDFMSRGLFEKLMLVCHSISGLLSLVSCLWSKVSPATIVTSGHLTVEVHKTSMLSTVMLSVGCILHFVTFIKTFGLFRR